MKHICLLSMIGIASLAFGQDPFNDSNTEENRISPENPSPTDSDTHDKIVEIQKEMERLQHDLEREQAALKAHQAELRQKEIAVAARRNKEQAALKAHQTELRQKEIAVAARRNKLQADLAHLGHGGHRCDQCHNGAEVEINPRFLPMDNEERLHGLASWRGFKQKNWRIGVQVAPYKIDGTNSSGVVVTRVLADSPAEKAGLRANDIIDSCNGIRVYTDSLREIVKAARGQVLTLRFRRGDQSIKHNHVQRMVYVTPELMEQTQLDIHPLRWLEKSSALPPHPAHDKQLEEREANQKDLRQEIQELRKMVEKLVERERP